MSGFYRVVPVFANFGKGIRLGQIGMDGNSSRTAEVLLPGPPKKVALNAYKEILEI